jgi:hypothetical protein
LSKSAQLLTDTLESDQHFLIVWVGASRAIAEMEATTYPQTEFPEQPWQKVLKNAKIDVSKC